MKILGILGGMGPYAALEFCRTLLDLTPAKKDWEHIHVLLDNNVKIPSRTRHLLYGEQSPTPFIIEAINKLVSQGASLIALPCNSVHYFYDEVSPHIHAPWINLIEVVSKHLEGRGLQRPLIVGGFATVRFQTYSKYIPGAQYLSESENEKVFSAIELYKLNQIEAGDEHARDFMSDARKYSFDSVILACTELSLSRVLKNFTEVPMIDSNAIYAKAIVEAFSNQGD